MKRTTVLLLAVLLAAATAAAAPGPAPSAVIVEVRGPIDEITGPLVAAEVRTAFDRGSKTVLLDLDALVPEEAPEPALALAETLQAQAERGTLAVLVRGRAAGALVAVVLACPVRHILPDAAWGPVPAEGPVRSAAARACRRLGLSHGVFERLLPGAPGAGVLTAREAVRAGFARRLVPDRPASLAALGVSPRDTEVRSIRPGAGGPPVAPFRGPFEKPFLIPIDRAIDDTLFESVKRRVELARRRGADLLIFEMDSPGGTVGASLDIGDYIFALRIPTLMLILKRAYSGAALIAISGDRIVMGEGGILGDCQPIAIGPGGYSVLGEKIQSPLRAAFRKYARKSGYPLRLAEAMVTQEMEVWRVRFRDGTTRYLLPEEIDARAAEHGGVAKKEIAVRKDELLTLTADKAFEYGFSPPPVADRAAAYALYGIEGSRVVRLTETWAERTSRFLLGIKALLFFAGIVALYMELKVPGFGVPGAIAIVAFVLFFSASYVAGIATGVEVVLFLLGVSLIALELLVIPGFGVPGIAGIALVVVSLYLASVKHGLPSAGRPWEFDELARWLLEFGATALASLIGIWAVARILPSTPIGRRLILAPAGTGEATGLTGSGSVESRRHAGLVGRTGRALSDLRPAGRIEVDGEPYNASSRGDYIPRGAAVEVLEVKGNRIMVKEI